MAIRQTSTVLVTTLALYALSTSTDVASEDDYDFRIFCCGVFGGAYSASLTSFLLAEQSDPFNFISMDAGTSYDCIKAGEDNGQLDIILDEDTRTSQNQYTKIGYFRKQQLNAFLLTHSHLDHNGGLIISSADDSFAPKPIISRPLVIEQFVGNIFQSPLWPPASVFGYYNVSINENNTEFTTFDTSTVSTRPTFNVKMKTFPLKHTVQSTAFLICNLDETSCVLFFGDTGPDAVEDVDYMRNIWVAVADDVADGTLNTIFLECSYTSSRADNLLFGHLTPRWMLQELSVLAQLVAMEKGSLSIEGVLDGLSVVVTHIKPTFDLDQDTDETRAIIEEELTNPDNQTYASMGVEFLIPYETDMIYVKSGKATNIASYSGGDGETASSAASFADQRSMYSLCCIFVCFFF